MNDLVKQEPPLVTGGMDVDESNRYLLVTDHHATLEDLFMMEDALRHHANAAQFVVKHYWVNGVYAREMLIPKGACLVGKIHAEDQIAVLTKGDISVISEEGTIRIKAPFVMTSKAGMKRAGYAHEDTIFMTFHHNPENVKDVDQLETRLTVPLTDLKLMENSHVDGR